MGWDVGKVPRSGRRDLVETDNSRVFPLSWWKCLRLTINRTTFLQWHYSLTPKAVFCSEDGHNRWWDSVPTWKWVWHGETIHLQPKAKHILITLKRRKRRKRGRRGQISLPISQCKYKQAPGRCSAEHTSSIERMGPFMASPINESMWTLSWFPQRPFYFIKYVSLNVKLSSFCWCFTWSIYYNILSHKGYIQSTLSF